MRLILSLFVLAAGCGNVDAVDPADEALANGPPTAHVRFGRGTATKSTGPLIDHGGKILPSSQTYAIWWGPSSGFPSDAQANLTELLKGLNGTGYLGIATQYLRGTAASTSFIGSYSDSSAPPKGNPNTSTIVTEACSIINKNGLTADPNGLYIVFTTNRPGANYCAWHDHGTCNGVDIQVAYLPNTTGVAGCDPGTQYNCNHLSQGTRSLADSLAHEFMEATTDPDLSSWYDQNGQEVGDKCNFVYSACVTINSSVAPSWQLQEEWSNGAGGCVQQ
jgi:hypothetical protein